MAVPKGPASRKTATHNEIASGAFPSPTPSGGIETGAIHNGRLASTVT